MSLNGGGHYILDDDGEPQLVTVYDEHGNLLKPALLAWARWFETADRTVLQTALADGIRVSTVFLGLDHRHSGGGAPLLWETMVFGGELDQEGARYASKLKALEGHQAMCERVTATLQPGGGRVRR